MKEGGNWGRVRRWWIHSMVRRSGYLVSKYGGKVDCGVYCNVRGGIVMTC